MEVACQSFTGCSQTEKGISRVIPLHSVACLKCIQRPKLPQRVAVTAACNCDVEADAQELNHERENKIVCHKIAERLKISVLIHLFRVKEVLIL